MKYKDLHKFPEGHPPSPYEFPPYILDVGEVELPAGLKLYAVGWIEKPGFATGDVPDEVVEALIAAYPSKLIPDGTRGWHICTLCDEEMPKPTWKGETIEVTGYGHYLVRIEDAVYMAPALLLHYILDHGYQPPQEFINAVINGQFLTTDDLEVIPDS